MLDDEKINPENKKALESGTGNGPTENQASDSIPGLFYSPDVDMERGFFKIWRKFFIDDPLWNENRRYSRAEAWIDILIETQFDEKPKELILKGESIFQNRGEVLRSKRGWAKRWNWSVDAVHRFFKILESVKKIRTQNERITTRITVLNYKKYNPLPNGHNTESRTHAERTPNADKSRLKKDKKEKNGKNKELFKKTFDLFWQNYPRRQSRKKAFEAWLKLHDPETVIEKLKTVLPEQKASDQWTRDNGKYIPLPATYINQARWEDEI